MKALKAFAAGVAILALAGCAGPDARPANKNMTAADHLDECMHKFNACQTDMWCAAQPICQQNPQPQRQPDALSVPQPRLPRVP